MTQIFPRLLFTFLAFSIFSMPFVARADEREDLIKRELDCVSQSFETHHDINWADVCYTDVPVPRDNGRDEVIRHELQRAERRQNFRAEREEMESTYEQDPGPNRVVEEFDNPEIDLRSENVRDQQKSKEFALQYIHSEDSADGFWPYYYSGSYADQYEPERKSNLYGLYFSYTHREPYNVPIHSIKDWMDERHIPFFSFVRAELDASYGKMSYNSDSTQKRDGIDNWQGNLRILGGYDLLSHDESFMATPYIGFGWKLRQDNSGGWVDRWVYDDVPFEKFYNFLYLPVGIETVKSVNDTWDIGAKIEGAALLWGKVALNYGDIPGSFESSDVTTGLPIYVSPQDGEVDLDGGFGFKTSLKIVRKFEKYNLFFEPIFEFWRFKQSKSELFLSKTFDGQVYTSAYPDGSDYRAALEPASYLIQYYLRIGVQF